MYGTYLVVTTTKINVDHDQCFVRFHCSYQVKNRIVWYPCNFQISSCNAKTNIETNNLVKPGFTSNSDFLVTRLCNIQRQSHIVINLQPGFNWVKCWWQISWGQSGLCSIYRDGIRVNIFRYIMFLVEFGSYRRLMHVTRSIHLLTCHSIIVVAQKDWT